MYSDATCCDDRELVGLDLLCNNDDGCLEILEVARFSEFMGTEDCCQPAVDNATSSALCAATAPGLDQSSLFSAGVRQLRCFHDDDDADCLPHSLLRPHHVRPRFAHI